MYFFFFFFFKEAREGMRAQNECKHHKDLSDGLTAKRERGETVRGEWGGED